MTTITAQDVKARYEQALDELKEYQRAHALGYKGGGIIEHNILYRRAVSWQRVADRVRAGGDPLLCVMSRE